MPSPFPGIDRAGFDLAIDYQQKPVPPLAEADRAWVEQLLKEKT
jgi:hypothetical protein